MARLLGISIEVFAFVVFMVGCGKEGKSPQEPLTEMLTVSITAPSAAVTPSNGVVHVEVGITGGAADQVQLLVDDVPVATLAGPYRYEWDTAGTTEGEHRLVARACYGAACFDSASRTVRVDRTGPAIVARTPAPDASNVWSRDPITVRFDEPLDPATVTTSAIRLVDRDDFPLAVQAPELSPDGTTLRVAPVALPEVPNTLTLVLNDTIADRAGNRIAETRWRWELPDWQRPPDPGLELGNAPSSYYNLAAMVDGDGNPILAFSRGDMRMYGTSLRVEQLRGGEWVTFGRPIHGPGELMMDLDARDHLAVGWIGNVESLPTDIRLRALLWDGSVDTAPTPLLQPDAQPQQDTQARLQLDGQGGMSLAWCDTTGVFASSWSTGAWTPIAVNADTACNRIQIVGPGPLVSWRSSGASICQGVAASPTWTGTCVPIAAGAPYGIALVPASDPRGPFHVITTSTACGVALQVKRNACLSPIPWTCDSPSTREWEDVGTSLNVHPWLPVSAVSARLDGDDRPVVAWSEGGTSLWVKRWDGSTWIPVGGDVLSDAEPGEPDGTVVAVGRTGIIAVAWAVDAGPYGGKIFVKRYNR